MSNRYNDIRRYMNAKGGKRGPAPTTKVIKERIPSDFYKAWGPPGENDVLNSQKVLFFEGDYTICPECGRPGGISNSSTSRSTFSCPNCQFTTRDMSFLLHLPTFPNMQLYMKGAGPKQKGHAVISNSHDGAIKKGDGSGESRDDALLFYSEKNLAEVVGEAESRYGAEWNREVPDATRRAIWKQALRLKPREHMAHNLVVLGHFHNVEVESTRGTKYTRAVPCTKGLRGKTGKRLTCAYCEAGLDRFFGQHRFWNPSEPISSAAGGPGKGHLATLRIYEAEKLSNSCKNCGNMIEVTGYNCPHCGKQVVDAYADHITEEDLTALANQESVCPHCGSSSYMEEVIECVHDTGTVDDAGDPVLVVGCDHPQRTTIFDVVLDLCVRGQNTDATLTILGHEVLTEDLRVRLGDLGTLTVPFDFSFLVDWSPALQSSIMNQPNPFLPGIANNAGTGINVDPDDDEEPSPF